MDAEVNVQRYKLFRQDRIITRIKRRGRDGGGTACYQKNEIAAGTDTIISFSNEVVDRVATSRTKIRGLREH